MLLQGKNAIVYGAAGGVGGPVSRAFAGEGAAVFLAGRTRAPLAALAAEIAATGGRAEVAVVDALDAAAVAAHADAVAAEVGRIDVSFNLMGLGGFPGGPVAALDNDDLIAPVMTALRGHANTVRAAAPHMAGGGVCLALTANVARLATPNVGGFGIACAAIESLWRQFAGELGPDGIRFVCLRSGGSPDTPGVGEAFAIHAAQAGITSDELAARFASTNPLRRLPMVDEVAGAAVLMASDKASAITAAVINVTCGGMVD